MVTREDYIRTGIDNKLSPEQINQALIKGKFPTLSKAESIMINEGTYGTNIGQRFAKGVKDLGGGLYTLTGMAGEMLANPELAKGVIKKIGSYAKEKGIGGAVVDTANLMLSPYNTSVEGILTNSPKETLTDIAAGAYTHPFDATLDTLPVLPKVGKLAKRIPVVDKVGTKAGEVIKRIPMGKAISSMVPNTTENIINESINTSKLATSNIIKNLDNLNTKVKGANPNDLKIAYKNLEQGKWVGNEKQIQLTEDLKALSKAVDEMNFKAGVNPDEARNLARTQFVTRELKDRGLDITNNDVRKLINDKNFEFKGVTKEEVQKLYKEADVLYNEGRIVPIKHPSDVKNVREGLVAEVDKLKDKGKPYSRDYGTHSYEDLAKALTLKGYDSEINKIERSVKIGDAVESITKEVGRKVTPKAIETLGKDEVIISPKLFKEKMAQSLANSDNIDNDIKALSRGLNTAEANKYSDDLYIFNKKDLQAIERGFTRDISNKNKLVGGLESYAKRSALATPRYMFGNLETNLGLNTLEGVTPYHHIYKLLHKDLIPDALKESTTFSGYLGKEGRAASSDKLSDIYKQLVNKYNQGNAWDKLEAVQQMTTTPFFYNSGGIESHQRIANYIRQAEKYAKANNRTVESVLREAKKNNGNNKLFRKLYTNVQHSLGDYTGRNYYMPKWSQEIASMFAPFVRPYTQPVRNLIYHSIENPMSSQLVMRNPARIGAEITRRAKEQNVQPNEDYGGGFPLLPAEGRYPSRVSGNPYQAYTALSELASNPSAVLTGNMMGITPLLGLMGKNRYGRDASLPNQVTVNGRKYILDNNGNIVQQSFLDNLQLAAVQSAQAYIAPVNQMNSFVLPLVAAFTNQEYRRPYDNALFGTVGNVEIPKIMQSDPNSRPKTQNEIILNMMGNTYSDTYKNRERLTPREIKQAERSIMRKRKRNERK